MDALTTAGFLLMGLTGSLHCAGMCGPLVWMMPFERLTPERRWAGIILYHTGRIAAYCLLGTMAFSLRSAFQPQWQQAVALISGALLLLAGIGSFFKIGSARLLKPVSGLIIRALGQVAGRSNPGWFAATGFLNGLLPCGMVYIALAAAMRAPDHAHVVAALGSFGLGTVPMLLAVTLLRRRIRLAPGPWIHGLTLAFGLLLMLRGANLGIPYLSPERPAGAEAVVPALRCCHP